MVKDKIVFSLVSRKEYQEALPVYSIQNLP